MQSNPELIACKFDTKKFGQFFDVHINTHKIILTKNDERSSISSENEEFEDKEKSTILYKFSKVLVDETFQLHLT